MYNQEINNKLMLQIIIIRLEKKNNHREATEIALRANKIIQGMLSGGVRFSYISRTGERREVTGTLTTYKKVFNKDYDFTKANQFVPYFNTDNCMWSVFHIASVVV